MSSDSMDDEIQEIIVKKPRRYTPLILKTMREQVLQGVREREEAAVAGVDEAASQVLKSKLDYLKKGLEADWTMAQQVQDAIALLEDEVHIWHNDWLRLQEANGQHVVDAYMSKRSAMHLCTNTIEWKDKASNMLHSIGNRHNMPHDQVYTVLLYDMNTPYARSKKGLKAAASLASKMASDNKSRCVVVCLLTDIAVKGAKVGVQDDDDNLIKEFSADGHQRGCAICRMV